MNKIINKIIAALFLALISISAFAGVTKTAKAITKDKYFEPVAADWNNNSQDIKAQQAAYVAAKVDGDFDAAHANSLFYFQDAWLYNNEANVILNKAGQTVEDINKALSLLDQADEAIAKDATTEKPHTSMMKDCAKKVAKNRKAAKEDLVQVE